MYNEAGPGNLESSMIESSGPPASQLHGLRPIWLWVLAGVLVATALAPRASSAQDKTVHLNPVIAKLAEGKTVYGLITSDLSLANARETARAPVDFVYVDMEHNPLDFPGLNIFLMGMTDRSAVLKKGNLQPNVALFARFPPEADQSQWVVKQALDIGLMGVIFNGVDSKEQALLAVRSMRYPQLRGSPRMEPAGLRGYGPTGATWIWGLSPAEYERRADVWPLNPDGDLLATIMIESADGLQRLDEIASVPGVGALFLGAGADLSRSLGVAQNAPELEAAFQQVLKACKAHKVACAVTANSADDVARRVREGWSIIRSTVPAISAGRALLGER
jgi:4-hydroxy-2-oxoheptanedioate aldolase